ncbi:MAG: hypothetical protein WCT53_05760 [Candidatus Gracilibacteria bacterium]
MDGIDGKVSRSFEVDGVSFSVENFVANPAEYIEELDKSGTLKLFFPALAATHGVKQSPLKHAEGDVFAHKKMALGLLRKKTLSDERFGGINNSEDLLLIALALTHHDTGKKDRNEARAKGQRMDHVGKSAEHAVEDLAEFLSEEELAMVVEMIKKHEIMSSTVQFPKRIQGIQNLFSLRGKFAGARLLLKFSECDMLGRIIDPTSPDAGKINGTNAAILERNVRIYELLKQDSDLFDQMAAGGWSPGRDVLLDIHRRIALIVGEETYKK